GPCSGRRPCSGGAAHPGHENTPGPCGPGVFCGGDPSGIRTRVTAVRGRRTRPLYDGAVLIRWSSAGIPGLEPRMTVPETVVLPITPYPTVVPGPAVSRGDRRNAKE